MDDNGALCVDRFLFCTIDCMYILWVVRMLVPLFVWDYRENLINFSILTEKAIT